jgi:hypothetical protein
VSQPWTLLHSRAVADKPRVKAPKQRTAARTPSPDRRRWALIAAGSIGALAVLVVAGLALGGFGSGGQDAQAALEDAGCTLQSFKGVSRDHISDSAARPKSWNSFPPTSGPHYVTPAVYGFYNDPVELARVLHGLEHGGVYILYGPKTPADTITELRRIYDEDPRGLVVAPVPELGDKIALGAWTSGNPGSAEVGTGHLAMCTQVGDKAFNAFIDAFRGRGPEGTPLNLLQPGQT